MNRLFQSKYFWVILLLINLVWTFLLYFRVTTFDFVNWDDNAYVYQNKDITELTIHSVSKFFSSFCLGMYQPLTMLSFAIEYYFFKSDPSVFHATNLLFHLLNVLLVFIFIRKLTANNLSAFIVSLFFGIHPLHVESVAWISERKDVLYTFFYLLGLISYIQYLKLKKSRFWIITIILFILSLFSKSAAVTFPLVLLLLHFYHQKEVFNFKNTILKIWPFFILSLFFGLLSFISQKTFDVHDISHDNYNQFNRIIISGFTYFIYIFHLVYPTVFSAVHPLPVQTGYSLPVIYYFNFSITIIILFFVCYFFLMGKKSQLYYNLLFGLFFYTFTIFLILYNPASKAVYADRYTYLPYIGLFFILSGLIQYLIDKSDKLKFNFRFISFCIILLLSVMYSINAYSFITNWRDSLSLWNKTISNEPSALAYFSRAIAKKEQGDINGAIKDYQTSISINDHFYQAYSNKASIFIEKKEYAKSLDDLIKVQKIKPDFPVAYYNLALVYYNIQQYKKANENIIKALKLEPDNPDVLILKATISIVQSDYSEALISLNKVIGINPSYAEAYYNRGVVYTKLNKIKESIIEFTSAIELKSNYGLAYYSRANSYALLNSFDEALRDVNLCLNSDSSDYMALTLRGYLLFKSDRFKDAINDLNKAIKLKPDYLVAYNNRALIYKALHENTNALQDLNYLLGKDPDFASALLTRAEIYIEQHDFKNACVDLQKAYKGGIVKAGILIDKNCR